MQHHSVHNVTILNRRAVDKARAMSICCVHAFWCHQFRLTMTKFWYHNICEILNFIRKSAIYTHQTYIDRHMKMSKCYGPFVFFLLVHTLYETLFGEKKVNKRLLSTIAHRYLVRLHIDEDTICICVYTVWNHETNWRYDIETISFVLSSGHWQWELMKTLNSHWRMP